MAEVQAGIALAALIGVLFWFWLKRDRLRRRFNKASQAEEDALHLARKAGYRVLSTQVAGVATIIVDGERLESALRADMLLSRWGRRYIGEVKSGKRAPDPKERATRRQLLEYSLAFEADGLLLFDMEKKRIRRIEFPRPGGRARAIRFGVLLGGLGGYVLAQAGPRIAEFWTDLAL
jgi:hypothetical protein